MKTGEKIALLRKRKELTQEQMAEILGVSRQSVSRWEMNMAFPEVDKLIRLSRLLECCIVMEIRFISERIGEKHLRSLPSKFIMQCWMRSPC